jgi:hypothetical protein
MREQLLLYRQRLLERLSTVREELAQAAAQIPAERWHAAAADGETPHRILARLRADEARRFSVRLWRILDEDEPRLQLFDRKRWLEEHYDPGEPYEDILAEYIMLRGEELEWLKGIAPQDWNRAGRHPAWGKKTLQWWVEQCLRASEEQLQRLKAAREM